jgi:hypothetical protein
MIQKITQLTKLFTLFCFAMLTSISSKALVTTLSPTVYGTVNNAGGQVASSLTNIQEFTTPLRGWFKFDITSIPTGSIINSVNLIYSTAAGTVNSGATNNVLYTATDDLSLQTGTTLFARCGTVGSGTAALFTGAWSGTQPLLLQTNGATGGNAATATAILSYLQGQQAAGFACFALKRGSSNSYNFAVPSLVINYTPPPCTGTPAIGSTTVSSALACAPAAISFNVTGATAATLSYAWQYSTDNITFNTIAGANTNTYTIPTTSAANTGYYRRVDTCVASTQFSQHNSVLLTVNAAPTVSVTPTSGSYCSPGGVAVALTASGSATSYAWSPAAGLSATTGTSTNATPATTTTYTVTGTDAVTTCTARSISTITVNSGVFISATTATPSSVCSGGSSVLATTASGGSLVNQYGFTAGTGATLDPMTGATTVLTTSNDDTPTPAAVNIGFPFIYNGSSYTQYSVSPDGWILLGGAVANNEYINVATSTANTPKIYPYWDDLATGTTGNVQTLVSGVAPNRIFIVQWFVTIPRAPGGPANSTFQAWLYEGSNIIEFRYGAMGTPTAGSASGGLTASTINFQSLTFASNASSITTSNDLNAGVPVLGTMYTYTPANISSIVWSPATFLSGGTSGASVTASNITASTTYTVTATSSNGCTATSTASISAGSALSVSSISASAIKCASENFTLTANVTGGGAPYTYAWDDGVSGIYPATASITPNKPAGTYIYTVTVTDNCTVVGTTTLSVTVADKPIASAVSSNTVSCGGALVAIIASATTGGAAGTYTYAWSPATGLSATTGTAVNANPIAATTYTTTVTDAATSCTGTTTISIQSGPSVSISSLTATPSAVCPGDTAVLTAIAITNGGAYCQPTYSTGTDFGDFCTSLIISGTSLNNPTGASPTPSYTLYPASGSTTATLVAGNTYTLTAIAGTFTINDIAGWIDYNNNGVLNNAGEKLGEVDNIGASPATATIIFTVPLTAFNGLARFRIREADQATTGLMDPCNALSFGETEDYTITITGGIDPLTYAWTPSLAMATPPTGATDTTSAINVSQYYTVTATSAAGCTATDSIAVNVSPLATGVASALPAAVCIGGSTVLSATTPTLCTSAKVLSFTGVYSAANWTPSASSSNGTINTATMPKSILFTSGNGPTYGAGSNTYEVSPECGGTVSFTWRYTTTDTTGNDLPTYALNFAIIPTTMPGFNPSGPQTQTGTATIPVGAFDVLDINLSTDNDAFTSTLQISGFSGPSASVTGTANFWSDSIGGTSLGGSPFTVTPTATDTFWAEYTTAVTGCVNPVRVPVVVIVNPLPTVTASVSPNDTVCANTMTTLSGGGASTYAWTGGITDATAFAATATATYTVTGTDVNGCVNTATQLLTVNALPTVTVTASPNDTVCINTMTTLSGGGASTYAWTGGITDATPFAATATATYTVTGTDVNGCVNTATQLLTVNALPTVTASVSPNDTVCINTMTTLSGGGANMYAWTGGITDATAFAATATATYTVTGTDVNGCVNTATQLLTVNALPTVTATPTTSTTCGSSSATLTGGGALAPYTWSGSQTITDAVAFTVTTGGTYTVTAADAAGCIGTALATVTVTSPSGDLSQATSGNLLTKPGIACNTSMQPNDGTDLSYYSGSCELIAGVSDATGGNALGSVTSCVTVEPSVQVWNGQPYVQRHYDITPTSNGPANVTLYYTANDMVNYNTVAPASLDIVPTLGTVAAPGAGATMQICVTQLATPGILGTSAVEAVHTVTATWNATKNRWELEFPVTGFSSFYCHACNPLNSPLSVKVSDFKGRKENTTDVLTWITNMENNNAYFNVQRSATGNDFTTIGKVNSKAPQGNSNAAISYSYVDITPMLGHNYYRLEQVDMDGKATIATEVIDLVWNANGSTVNVYPNPTRDVLNIDIAASKEANTMIKLLDMSGRVVKQIQARTTVGVNNIKVSLSELANGVYTLQVLENGKLTQVDKVRKQD